MKSENLAVILVEPQGPINIGSVCRAMMNFGFSDLRLVNPCRGYRSMNARKMALGAQPILNSATHHPDLESALKDCHLAFGTTRRFGKYRKEFLTPGAAGKTISRTGDAFRCALVLGREDNGLKTSELDLCQHFVTIPTSRAYGSMNLSHALAVCLYEVSKALNEKTPGKKNQKRSADVGALENLYSHMGKTLLEIEFLDPQNPDHLMRTFRRLFGRASLSDRDVRIIQGLMSRIDWIEGERKKLLSG